jgi:type IV secretion system protein VirD4
MFRSDHTVVYRRLVESPLDVLLVTLLALAVTVMGGTWLVGQLAGLLFRGTWPDVPVTVGLSVAGQLPHHWADPRQAWPAAVRPDLPGPVAFAASALLVVLLTATLIPLLVRQIGGRHQVRGYASRVQLRRALSERAALARLPRLRPGLTASPPGGSRRPWARRRTRESIGATPAGPREQQASTLRRRVQDVAVDLGRAVGSGMQLWGSVENSVLLLAAPRQGKTSQVIIPWLHHWPGPALVTSVRRDIALATLPLREKVGPVAVLDLTDVRWPCPLRWSLTANCERFDRARQRADVMVVVGKPETGPSDATNAGFFGLTSTNLLAGWLHAAALTERTADDVLRWALDERDDESIRLLRDHPDAAPGVAAMLDNIYRSPVETRSNMWTTVMTAVAPLLSQTARRVFCPPPGDSLNIPKFLAASGTAYLLVPETEAGDLAPLIAALVDEVTRAAAALAEANPSGRLDPPLALVLDEVANVAPLPNLPALMSYAAGSGIFVIAVLQELAQARSRWGRDGADMLWGASTLKIALGGLGGDELTEFANLAGEWRETLVTFQYAPYGTSEQATLVDRKTILPHEIRTLREDRREALIIHATTPAVRTRMRRHYESADAAAYAASVDEVHRRLRATSTANLQGQNG